MPVVPPARVGMTLDEVDTPALVVDLDAFENNLKRMADFSRQSGIRLRPHAKTHKSVLIAQKQIELGAVGVCCQKVSEAEILVEGGIGDILISNEIAGPQKIARLVSLARKARIAVCTDSSENVRELAEAAEQADVRLSVLLEIDVGGNRCGAAPGAPALALASEIVRSNTLHFAGLQAYHGPAQHLRSYDERRSAIESAAKLTGETIALLSDAGIRCDTVGGAGSGTFDLEAGIGVINELQAGSYIFMDADYARNKKVDGSAYDEFENALFVLSTVMSRPNDERAIVDAGHKAIAVDSGMPELFQRPGISYHRPSDEHGVLRSDGGVLPKRTEKILIVPSHCDPTVNLHDWYICVRGLRTLNVRVESVWPVSARGCYF